MLKKHDLRMILIVISVAAIAVSEYLLLANKKFNVAYILAVICVIVPAFIVFERKKIQKNLSSNKRIILISSLCAVSVSSRILFSAFPYFKPTLAIIITAASLLSPLDGFILGGVCVLASNAFLGHGIWTLYQVFVFGMCGFIASITLKHKCSKLRVCAVGIVISSLCSLVINVSSFLVYSQNISFTLFFTYLCAGIPTDIVLIVSTTVFLFLFFPRFDKTFCHICAESTPLTYARHTRNSR